MQKDSTLHHADAPHSLVRHPNGVDTRRRQNDDRSAADSQGDRLHGSDPQLRGVGPKPRVRAVGTLPHPNAECLGPGVDAPRPTHPLSVDAVGASGGGGISSADECLSHGWEIVYTPPQGAPTRLAPAARRRATLAFLIEQIAIHRGRRAEALRGYSSASTDAGPFGTLGDSVREGCRDAEANETRGKGGGARTGPMVAAPYGDPIALGAVGDGYMLATCATAETGERSDAEGATMTDPDVATAIARCWMTLVDDCRADVEMAFGLLDKNPSSHDIAREVKRRLSAIEWALGRRLDDVLVALQHHWEEDEDLRSRERVRWKKSYA